MELLTQAAYARHREVTPAAVHKYIRDGKIPRKCLHTRKGKKLIDRDAADQALYENLDRIMNPKFNNPLDELPSDALAKIREAGCESLTLEEAQRLQAHFKAELLKLEYEQKTGIKIPAKIVEDKTFAHARGIRDSILMVPDRVSAEIAAATTEAQVREILTNAMNEALVDLDEMPDFTEG
jgi:hypothetical protein